MSANATSALTIKVGVAGVVSAQTALKGLAGSVKGLFSFAGVELNVKQALKNAFGDVTEYGARLKNLAAQTGANITALVAIEKAFKRVGMSAEESGGMVARMQRTIAQAATGRDSGLNQVFGLLGLDAKALSKENADQQMLRIGQAIDKLGNSAQRAQVAIEVFGRGGNEMLRVFRDPVAMQLLGAGGGTFGKVIQRNAESFKEFNYEMAKFSSIWKQVVAGFLDMMPLDELSRLIDRFFKAFDFTGLGQRFGAWVATAIDYWKAGRLDEIISLTVTTGFDIALKALPAMFQSIGYLMIKAFEKPLLYVQAAVDYTVNRLQWRTNSPDLAKRMDAEILSAEQKRDKSVPAFGILFASDAEKKAMAAAQAEFLRSKEEITKRYQQQSWRDTLGARMKDGLKFDFGTGEFGSADIGKDASTRWKEWYAQSKASIKPLLDLISETQAKIEAIKGTGAQQGNGAFIDMFDVRRHLAQQELALKEQLYAIDTRRIALEGDRSLTSAEKWAERKKALEDEKKSLQSLIDLNSQLITRKDTSETDRQLLLQRNTSYQGQLQGVNSGISKMGANPYDVTEQFRQTFDELKEAHGTFAQNLADEFKNVYNSAISSISNGISSLIMGTKNWGQALQQIGSTILSSVVNAIARMVTDWITGVTLMGTKYIATQDAMAATDSANNAKGMAEDSARAVSANAAGLGKSGEQMGWKGLIIYAAVLASTMAAVTAISRRREHGGPVSAGIPYLVGERRAEIFVPNTSGRIVPSLQAYNDSASGSQPSQSRGGVAIALVDNRNDLRDFMESHSGQEIIVKTVNRHRLRFGMNT